VSDKNSTSWSDLLYRLITPPDPASNPYGISPLTAKNTSPDVNRANALREGMGMPPDPRIQGWSDAVQQGRAMPSDPRMRGWREQMGELMAQDRYRQ